MSGASGRHALVTGAARGIGAAVASVLAREGARVTLLGRNRETLTAQAARLEGASGTFVAIADASDEAQIRAAFAAAEKALGPVEILVNNAGIATSRAFHKMDATTWDEVLNLNLRGAFLCCVAAIGAMRAANWGRIVNVASVAGLAGAKFLAAYNASKHGLVGLTRSLAVEYAGTGITVNAVCPGFVETDMFVDAIEGVSRVTGRGADEARAAILEDARQARAVSAEEVAATIAWLCSPAASAVTGQAIAIEASGRVA